MTEDEAQALRDQLARMERTLNAVLHGQREQAGLLGRLATAWDKWEPRISQMMDSPFKGAFGGRKAKV